MFFGSNLRTGDRVRLQKSGLPAGAETVFPTVRHPSTSQSTAQPDPSDPSLQNERSSQLLGTFLGFSGGQLPGDSQLECRKCK